MGNIVTREPKFKIKNDTLFPIYVMLTQVKYKLATDNIQPGLRGNSIRTIDKVFKSKRINSIVEGLLNEEEDEQRNRVVLEAYPVMFGFKEILPGQEFRSRKMWTKVQEAKGTMYFTLLTRQFLIQGLKERKGQARIDENPVGPNSYNLPFYNVKQEDMDRRKRLVIATSPSSGNLEIYCQ